MGYLDIAKQALSTVRKSKANGSQSEPSPPATDKPHERRVMAFSQVLGREIVLSWVGDDAKVVYIDRTPYTTKEIAKLKGASPERVRGVHLVKETFDGRIINEDRQE